MHTSSGIQIIGTQRSGSNLLRVILDQSAEIASPHPPHTLTTFMPLLPLYGKLNAESYRTLVSDVVDYVSVNPVPWEGVDLDKDAIFFHSTRYSLMELNKLIYEAAAASKNATYWCCKSMGNVHYARELATASPQLKYVFLYRDGRDVAASFKKAVVGEKHSYHLALQWKKDQLACIHLREKLPADQFYALNYETLIADPKQTVQELCQFLGIKYVDSMLNFYESRTSKLAAEAGEMWSNLKKPIMPHNSGKYREVFNGDDLAIFEAVAGEVLQKLGYALHSDIWASSSATREALLTTEKHAHYATINARLKAEVLEKANPADLANRLPQEQIIKRIRMRNGALNQPI
ncbi:Sulfotransferase family protein [bacterium A37T11]|nr:Sulfotransferase family protein [bacterium A37T11]